VVAPLDVVAPVILTGAELFVVLAVLCIVMLVVIFATTSR
jgi:hypothetical protein